MTAETATLLSAGIAAAASVMILLGNLIGARGAEARSAHRNVLEPHLPDLGEALHEVVASAVLQHRRAQNNQAPGAAGQFGAKAAEILKAKRIAVRYPLRCTGPALRTLSRLPDWASTYKGHESGDELIGHARELGRLVDAVIARSYARGRPPTRFERWRVERQNKRLLETWERRFGAPDTT
jgi:hypothetical protein